MIEGLKTHRIRILLLLSEGLKGGSYESQAVRLYIIIPNTTAYAVGK